MAFTLSVYLNNGISLSFTLSGISVAPWKATGASSVGGTPANGPVVAIHDLQFIKKLKRTCTSTPSMKTRDCGCLSFRLSLPMTASA